VNLAKLYLERWPERSDTRATYATALAKLSALLGEDDPEKFDWAKLRSSTVRSVGARLAAEGLAPATINKHLSVLRGVLELAWREGALPDVEYRKIEVKNVKGRGDSVGRELSEAEIDAVHTALAEFEPRDAALITIMAACGCRRVEVVRMRVGFYNAKTFRLKALGKGNKVREVPVAERWRVYIERWQAGRKVGEPLFGDVTRRQVSYVVERLRKKIGSDHFTPHDFRRTFLTLVIRNSDPLIAQRLGGHESLDTTKIYDKRKTSEEDDAVKGL
jgi:integrase